MPTLEDQRIFDEVLKSLRVHAPKLPEHVTVAAATDIVMKVRSLAGPSEMSEQGLAIHKIPR